VFSLIVILWISALSDLILALTIPFTAMDVLHRPWPLGTSLFPCRLGSSDFEITLKMDTVRISSKGHF
jgi:hypothetical protein